MEQTYNDKMKELGYDQLVCDIFTDWENVKDEILLKERKEGTGSGTVHVFLGAGDSFLRREFASYYDSVENGEDPSVSAFSIKHYFLRTNVLSMIGYLCQYHISEKTDFTNEVQSIISELDTLNDESGLLTTTSLFKLSTGSNKLRPYFKQFDENGVFYRVIRHLLLPQSAYKISLYKNEEGEYAAFWLIGFDSLSAFEVDSDKENIKRVKNHFEGRIIVSDATLSTFILSVIKHFNNVDGLSAIVPYTNNVKSGMPIKVSKDDDFKLVGMFIESSLSDIKTRNKDHQRWFEDIFKLGERNVFLSTQWNAQGNYQLTLSDFIKMVKCCYGNNYSYKKDNNGEHQLVFANDRNHNCLQHIYYGTPGSGKSNKVKKVVESLYFKENEREEYVFRTTFHPDSDYASFVGSYKPKMEGKEIRYEFTPQAFTNAYVKAWLEPDKQVYLIIEEINRGNCAQIFGDLFQLLDRNDGVSEYPINADADLRQYLEKDEVLGEDSEGIANGKLKLPANLNILATMNTSDQSLFPMDSAFKRRWTWECVPIDYENADSSKFMIKINGKVYNWHKFLKNVNERIKSVTQSEDKQMGNFFISSNIDERQFIDKVMFYLWNDICKEEYKTTNNFFRNYTNDAKTDEVEFTFNDLFDKTKNGDNKLLVGFMDYIGVEAE